MAQAPAATIYVLNGPNLNMLGTREPETYGHATLADVEKLCVETAAQFGLKADCRQSNREGELIDFIHEAHAKKVVGKRLHKDVYVIYEQGLAEAEGALRIAWQITDKFQLLLRAGYLPGVDAVYRWTFE
jgi:3-dehydroquinate dehydratase-2